MFKEKHEHTLYSKIALIQEIYNFLNIINILVFDLVSNVPEDWVDVKDWKHKLK